MKVYFCSNLKFGLVTLFLVFKHIHEEGIDARRSLIEAAVRFK